MYVTPKSGQESFQVWLQQLLKGFIDATAWEEFHRIADAHGVRLDLRANGFVFTHRRSLVRVKASSISCHLGKLASVAVQNELRQDRARTSSDLFAHLFGHFLKAVGDVIRNLVSDPPGTFL
jgi:hypothetical protein